MKVQLHMTATKYKDLLKNRYELYRAMYDDLSFFTCVDTKTEEDIKVKATRGYMLEFPDTNIKPLFIPDFSTDFEGINDG